MTHICTDFLCQTPADMLEQSKQALRACGQEGADLFPNAKLSHIRVRTHTQADYQNFIAFAENHGDVIITHANDHSYAFAHLHKELKHKGQKVEWIEICEPQAKAPYNGVDALVYADPILTEPTKQFSAVLNDFTLRCQPNSAFEITAANPSTPKP